MSKAIVLQHVEFECPGRIVDALRDYGIPIEVRRLYRGDEVPTDPAAFKLLVVMGGPMGVADIGSEKHPYLANEVALLKQLVAADRPTLGICLGAQLLAHAAGAKVYPNTRPGATANDPPVPVPEIGWGPVNFPFPGGTEPILYGLHDGTRMFHWHFDTFDLPKLPPPANAPAPGPGVPAPPSGNVLLSSTRACRNQAYRFKNRLVGFQYHFEMTPEAIEGMLEHGKADVEKVLGAGGADQIRADTKKYYAEYQRLGNRLIRNLIEFLDLV